MKKTTVLLLLFLIAGLLPAFAAKHEIITPATQLQKRQFQTRTYEAADIAVIMKAVLNVLQDEGFIVDNANPLLGFISGCKEFDVSDKTIDTTKEFGVSRSKLAMQGVRVAVIDTTANVTKLGKEAKIRINFKRKLLNVYGSAKKIDEINDEKYYQDFFAKVDKAIFLQKQKI